jgi:branched-subunit amino acid aminotransferase/4-amino-4-deoxychorismate lyase
MRRFLLDELKKNGYRVHQEEISEKDVEEADEVFLTNSIYDIRWVQSFRGKKYSFEACLSIYKLIKPILYSI